MLYYETKHPEREEYSSFEYFKDFKFPLHLHNHLELAYVLDGMMDVRIGEMVHTVKKGEICMIRPMEAHAYATRGTSSVEIVVLSQSYLEDFESEYRRLNNLNPIIRHRLNDEFMSAMREKHDNKYAIKGLLNYLAALYIEQGEFEEHNKKLDSFIRSAIEYIDENFDKSPSIEELADKLGYAKHYVFSLFSSTFDKTFVSIINERRIAKASKLLRSTDMTITEIADSCGYASVRSFNRNFVVLNNMTPTAFRELKPANIDRN